MVITDKTCTLREFDTYIYNNPKALVELINGRMIEKVTGTEHGRAVANILYELVAWYKQNGIDGHYGTEVHHTIDDETDTMLQPDVSFSYRITQRPGGTVQGLPDFVVEVKSPGNSYDDLRDKARLYIANGTKLVWLVYPTRQIVETYAADGTNDLFTSDMSVSGGDVLPGFSMGVSDIFA